MHCPNPPYPSSFFFSLSSSSDYFPDARSCCQKLGGHSLSRKCVPPSPNCAKLLEAGHCRVALPPLTGCSLNRIPREGWDLTADSLCVLAAFTLFIKEPGGVVESPAGYSCPALSLEKRPQAETMDVHSSPRFLSRSGCV